MGMHASYQVINFTSKPRISYEISGHWAWDFVVNTLTYISLVIEYVYPISRKYSSAEKFAIFATLGS